LRLIKDEMPVERIGPLFGAVATASDPDPALTLRVESVLKAFAAGGKAVEEVSGVAPQARADYAHGPAPELAGIRELAFIAAQDVGQQNIERHGAKVSRILYGRMRTNSASRKILVYLTADGLVTDQDVGSE
jgi:hypothetical protein